MAWTVLPHGELTQLANNLWSVRGSLPRMSLPRYMALYRLGDGTLLVHSCICLDEKQMERLTALGTPSVLVVPSEGHRLDAVAYKERFPGLQVVAPRNARSKVEQVIRCDADAEDVLPALGVRIHRPDGMKEGYELVYEVDLEGGGTALLVNDILANPDPSHGFISGMLGPPEKKFGQARIVRFFFNKDREKFRRFVGGLAEVKDLRIVHVSHGDPLTNGCADSLRECVSRL